MATRSSSRQTTTPMFERSPREPSELAGVLYLVTATSHHPPICRSCGALNRTFLRALSTAAVSRCRRRNVLISA